MWLACGIPNQPNRSCGQMLAHRHRHDDPWAYLRDVPERILTHPNRGPRAVLPGGPETPETPDPLLQVGQPVESREAVRARRVHKHRSKRILETAP